MDPPQGSDYDMLIPIALRAAARTAPVNDNPSIRQPRFGAMAQRHHGRRLIGVLTQAT